MSTADKCPKCAAAYVTSRKWNRVWVTTFDCGSRSLEDGRFDQSDACLIRELRQQLEAANAYIDQSIAWRRARAEEGHYEGDGSRELHFMQTIELLERIRSMLVPQS